MKLLNKSIIAPTFVMIIMILSAFTYAADEVILPIISKPAMLQEGTQRELTSEQIADLLPWAENSALELKDLLDSVKKLSVEDKIERLIEGIQLVIQRSSYKNSELLMRYILNRALVVHQVLSEEMDSNAAESFDVKLRILSTSIAMAIDYSSDDIFTLSSSKKINYAMFGKVYYSFLYELNKSIFDASAQYKIQKIALEWFQWDLYRDVNNKAHAELIVKINNTLKLYPAHELTDSESMQFVRQLKKFSEYSELNDKMLVHKNISSRSKNLKEKLDVGDVVYILSGSYSANYSHSAIPVTITRVADDNRYDNIDSKGYKSKRMPRSFYFVTSGCGAEFCVGDELLHNDLLRNSRQSKGTMVSIIGVSEFLGYVVKDQNDGSIYIAFTSNLHHVKGCRNNLCIGDRVTLKGFPNRVVEIVQLNANECDVKYVEERIFGNFYYNYDLSVSYESIVR